MGAATLEVVRARLTSVDTAFDDNLETYSVRPRRIGLHDPSVDRLPDPADISRCASSGPDAPPLYDL